MRMTRVTLDQATLEKLRHFRERMEICDESGRSLGYIMPAEDRSLYESVEVPVSEEQLRKAEQEPGGYTTAEVLAHLRRLETP
jgi:hypothetical protein